MVLEYHRQAGLVRSQRRKLVWATTDQSVNIPAGQISNTNLAATLSVAGASLLGTTIMRTHLRIEMTSIAGQATTDQYRIGLIVGRTSDVGINVAGQQDPSNPELDWVHLDRVIPTASGATVDSTQHWVLDNRSKRKMQELNQAYLLCLQQNAAAARTFNIFARVLFALP
ncbi:hypothetical protein A0R81_gp1 [Lake Sarah-associated circular molecule 4]|uniref:hypothetical protein n=1 Tax=Lake Sarah-associated circular molecule 4 TaxID=1685729 RepID=UPI000776D33F|nr:hypothetical protein A0R81_gp1 [Lake Sarah-associated circular molecule 4]ALE29541.1 hypothetical protein [Lake Sarah-associated circular molecule 4]